ncbi:MAG: hypothetical protein JNL88_02010 [Bacteroidia bacterium]|nr:hypothetical protein [Bacteroidia bacterium]
MPGSVLLRFLLLIFLGILVQPARLNAQAWPSEGGDTLRVKSGMLVILPDTFFVTASDTLLVGKGQTIRLREDPMQRSKDFYDSLAVRAGKSRMKRDLHRLFVRDNNPVIITVKNDRPREEYFSRYNGKLVRSIRVLRVPIIDGNVNDTAWPDSTRLGRWMNWHPQTQKRLLKGKGVVEVGAKTSGAALADMERLVRELQTIRDARLYVSAPAGSDSIDLVMVTQDLFPIRLNFDYRTPDNFIFRITDRNLTGSAAELGLAYERRASLSPVNAYTINLQQVNLFNRFITGRLYALGRGSRTEQGVEINREYLSAILSDMGGISFRNITDRVYPDSGLSRYHLYKSGAWYGHAFTPSAEWSFIPVFAFDWEEFTEVPASAGPSSYATQQKKIVLGGLNLIKRSFLRTALVKVFGTSEYIPVGYKLNLTGGYEKALEFDRFYSAGQFEYATFVHDAGYFSLSALNARFFRAQREEDNLLVLKTGYYSPLLKLGRTRWRQFVDGSYRSIDRPFTTEPFSTGGPWEDSLGVSPAGDRWFKAGFRTVFFMPWYFYGFRFSFYDGIDMNWIRQSEQDKQYRYFPSFRLGLRIQNDYLTYTAFSFQLAFYPEVKGYEPYLSFSLKTFILPVFDGLRIERPAYHSGSYRE